MTLDEEERLRRVAELKEKKRLENIEKEAVKRRINEDRVRALSCIAGAKARSEMPRSAPSGLIQLLVSANKKTTFSLLAFVSGGEEAAPGARRCASRACRRAVDECRLCELYSGSAD